MIHLKPLRELKHLARSKIQMQNAVDYAMQKHGWCWTHSPRTNDIEHYARIVGTLSRTVIETAIAYLERERDPKKRLFSVRLNKDTQLVTADRIS